MEYFIFVLIIIALVLVIVLLNRIEKRTKLNIKKTAYRLLETVDPTPKEILDTIKGLRLYGGRIRKDQECIQLVNRLQKKLDAIEKPG
jgi:regulatory protein YycI of two-component signal transduction system YycFG